MNRTEKNALAARLEKIAEKLADAKSSAERIAQKHASETSGARDSDRYPLMVGSLEFSTANAAEEIRDVIRECLTPRPTK